jgi:hypothetical protein
MSSREATPGQRCYVHGHSRPPVRNCDTPVIKDEIALPMCAESELARGCAPLKTSWSAQSLTFQCSGSSSPPLMIHLMYALLATARSSLKSRLELALENLALRQQLVILTRTSKRPKATARRQARREKMEANRGQSCGVCGPPSTQRSVSVFRPVPSAPPWIQSVHGRSRGADGDCDYFVRCAAGNIEKSAQGHSRQTRRHTGLVATRACVSCTYRERRHEPSPNRQHRPRRSGL